MPLLVLFITFLRLLSTQIILLEWLDFKFKKFKYRSIPLSSPFRIVCFWIKGLETFVHSMVVNIVHAFYISFGFESVTNETKWFLALCSRKIAIDEYPLILNAFRIWISVDSGLIESPLSQLATRFSINKCLIVKEAHSVWRKELENIWETGEFFCSPILIPRGFRVDTMWILFGFH